VLGPDDPRQVGGRYRSGYWGREYEVLAFPEFDDWRGRAITVRWEECCVSQWRSRLWEPAAPYPVHCSAALRAHFRDHPRVTLRAQMGLRAGDEERRTNRERGVRLPAGSIKARSAGTYPTFRRARGSR